jgi:hypothetical protein
MATLAAKTAVKHPKPTFNSAKFVLKHRQGLLKAVRSAHKARRASPPIFAKVSNPEFQKELASALSALQAAFDRSSKLGPTKTVKDNRVARLVREAGSHLTVALQVEPKRKSHRLRKLALVALVGGVAVAGAQRLAATSG